MYPRIKDLREAQNLTQEHLANYLNIHQSTYSNYESGRLNVPVVILEKLADFYGTSVDYLIGRTSEVKPYPKK